MPPARGGQSDTSGDTGEWDGNRPWTVFSVDRIPAAPTYTLLGMFLNAEIGIRNLIVNLKVNKKHKNRFLNAHSKFENVASGVERFIYFPLFWLAS